MAEQVCASQPNCLGSIAIAVDAGAGRYRLLAWCCSAGLDQDVRWCVRLQGVSTGNHRQHSSNIIG